MNGLVENLYEAFSDIPQRQKVEGCTNCCISETELIELSKHRKTVAKEALSRLAHNAMSTVGDVDDYLYFLPRIFEEIFSDRDFWTLTASAFTSRLKLGGYEDWDEQRRRVVDAAILKIFERSANENDYRNVIDWLGGLALANFDLSPYFAVLENPKHNSILWEIMESLETPMFRRDHFFVGINELTTAQFKPFEKWRNQVLNA